jgi:two-component system sensor histidine kinase KdpD
VKAQLRPVALEDVVPLAVAGLDPSARRLAVTVPETLPEVLADPALLERAVANLVGNALRHSPDHSPVRVEAGAFGDHIDLRVIDSGPGVPVGQRDRIFEPFQRSGDHDPETGVGLGLAVARGFVQAMAGTLELEDTPGGGLTAIVTLPCASTVRDQVVMA